VRQVTYAEAIREGFAQMLETDPRVFVMGQGVWSPWYVGTSMKDLDRKFGRGRVLDTPVSEAATTGAAIGAALAGMRPVVIHPRMDFMLLAVEQIVGQASNWHYMFGGKMSVPVTFRALINRGGEQAAQHSQSLHAWFAHIPGLKVVMPATAYDAKGLLIASILDDNPVLYFDDRWLYGEVGDVPETAYSVPIGKAALLREGGDVTVVASSYMTVEARKAADVLEKEGVACDLIDLRTVKPLDMELIFQSLRKTGRLVIADGGWATNGLSAEIAAQVACGPVGRLKAPVVRVCLPDCPAPMSGPLEKAYYRTAEDVSAAVRQVLRSS
jgi:acetoin:2,6-dichlorophenolindophenol oxidoreductase subunit beta